MPIIIIQFRYVHLSDLAVDKTINPGESKRLCLQFTIKNSLI